MQIISINYSEKPMGLTSHYHNCHQIIYIVSGNIKLTVNNKTYLAKSNSLLLLSRFEEHSIKVLGTEYKRFSLNISPASEFGERDDRLLSSVLVNRPENFQHIIDVEDCAKVFENLFKNMKDEYKKKPSMFKEMLTLDLKQLLVHLYRIKPEIFCEDLNRNTEIIYKIQNEFENNYSESYNLSELSSKYHISRYHLSRLFKKVTGYAPIEYLLNARLSAAKKYLCTTTLSVQEIVELCGFGDESNFSRTFRQRTEMTPTAFRKNYSNIK